MFDLSGKTALVTGSTQGIGFEIARLLSKQGAKVFVVGAKRKKKCEEASSKIPNSLWLMKLLNFITKSATPIPALMNFVLIVTKFQNKLVF